MKYIIAFTIITMAILSCSDKDKRTSPSLQPSSAIHVPADYASIQTAIVASRDGDTILVAPGIYAEHINFVGRAIVLKSEQGPEVTFIEKVTTGEPIVKFISGEGRGSILVGFTVRNSLEVPGVLISASSPRISNNTFTNNSNDDDGGAIQMNHGSFPEIIGSLFTDNLGMSGGAIAAYQSNALIVDNEFHTNSSLAHGGALFRRQSIITQVHHNLFYDNHCQALGGALCFSEDSGCVAFNNTVVSNVSNEFEHGAGITIWYSSNCRAYNNIVANNQGKGIYDSPHSGSVATYNDVWNNQLNYDGISPGTGSISLDPMFIGGSPFLYHLQSTSPCISAGDPSSPNDPDGSRADMGAFYFNHH